MNNCRATDAPNVKTFRVRVSRFFKQWDRWYFNTREGTTEGPFYDRREAEEKLVSYLRLVGSGFYDEASQYELVPINRRV